MDATLEKIDLNNLDKSSWKTYRFDEIAEKISKTVKPEESNVDVYIGLEHIDGEDIHIHRTGKPSDVKGGKLRCYPGDVIFGKRRAYQRKAAIVDFEGICSAHAFVLRANSEVINPKLFPFFLHSDQFMHRMVDISVGGLSPTINWGDLKQQKFLLPSKAEQAQLTKLLFISDELVESEKKVNELISINLQVAQKTLFDKEIFSRTKLSNYSNVLGGFAFSSSSFISKGIPVVKIKNIVKGNILIKDELNYVAPLDGDRKMAKYFLSQDDILIAMTGATLGKIGKVQKKYDGALLNQRVGKFQFKKAVNPWCMRGILDSNLFRHELNKYIGEGAQGNISSDGILKIQVPKLSEIEMEKIGDKFKKLYESKKVSVVKISKSKELLKTLINQVF